MSRIFFLALLSFALFNSCNILDPHNGTAPLSLYLEDVSCTEVWLRLNTSNISLPVNIALINDDQIIKNITLISNDSLVYIDSLQTGKSYKFQAVVKNNIGSINSGKLSAVSYTHLRAHETG